ncbi:MAG: hypothetical protein JWO36_4509 [Myxococcales bacterium]|nr:hypothetical protein [Myxococcales bacterium]
MTDSRSDDEKLPRWVKISGIITIVFILVFVVVHLAGGGFDHDHGGHMGSDH